MRQVKFYVTLYAKNKEQLRKDLVAKGIIPTDIQPANKTKKQKLVDYLDTVLADNDDYTTEQIAATVLKQRKVDGDVFLDNVVLNKKRKEYITVVDTFEMTITVERACGLAGI